MNGNKLNPAFKIIFSLAISGFFLAATECKKEVIPARELKKNIQLVQLDASHFLDNSGFSFSEVARSQFSGVVFEKNNFFERSMYPQAEAVQGFGDQKYFNVISKIAPAATLKTVQQLKTWFPNAKTQDILLSRESSCFMSRPQHYIFGKINSLEAYSGGSLQFGFNQNIVQAPLSAKFKMDKMRMDLSFRAMDPWTQQITASVNSEVFKNDYSAGFGIDLGFIHIGPEFYRVTGMAEVILKGLRAATQELAKVLTDQPRQAWSTRVVYSRDNYVALLGGAELGLKKGDQLKVFNEVHTWNGEACGASSIVTGSIIVSDIEKPWILEVEEAGDLLTRAKVLNVIENDSIATGALVKLHAFVALPVAKASATPSGATATNAKP